MAAGVTGGEAQRKSGAAAYGCGGGIARRRKKSEKRQSSNGVVGEEAAWRLIEKPAWRRQRKRSIGISGGEIMKSKAALAA